MKTQQLKKYFFNFFILIALVGCKKSCDESLRIGEIVQIPLEFVGFSISEINNIRVYRIDKSNPSLIDTFFMRQILWANEALSTSEIITDKAFKNSSKSLGYYKSYFDNCDLILDWYFDKDTLSDFVIKKSKEEYDDCHKNDPNVRIDRFSFVYKGKIISKNESIQITK